MDFPGGLDGKEFACSAGDPRVQSLGWEDSLEKGMAIHSSVVAWRIPWTEEPGGLQSLGLQRVQDMTERLTLSLSWTKKQNKNKTDNEADISQLLGFPGGSDGKKTCLPCRRPGFDPWVGKIP